MQDPVIYCTFIETRYQPELGYYTTYGIEAAPLCRCLDSGERLKIHDISIRRQEVEHLAHRLNLGKLSVWHLRDVVEDALAVF